MKGTDLARAAGATVHADVIDSFKEQMLLAMVRQAGGHVVLKVKEIDDTGGWVMSMQLVDGPDGQEFHFKTEQTQ